MRSRHLPAAIVSAALLVTGLSACSDAETDTSADTATDASASSKDQITVEHAYGETTLDAAPERVATVGWANHEVPLAHDIVPVGMDKATWGDDDGNGIMPWVEDKLAELGADEPVLFDTTDALPYEQIANTEPDVILASYSGITQEEYDQLSQIAPTIAYPDVAWGTTLDEMIEMNSAALGKQEEGEQLQEDLDAQVADALAAHPELEGTNVAWAFIDDSDFSQIGIYTADDPRHSFLVDAGMSTPTVVAEETETAEAFFSQVSAENPERFEDVDLMIMYGSSDDAANQELLESYQADPLLGRIPAIAEGRVAFLGDDPLAAAGNPSPLSIPWGIDEYFDTLAAAL